MSGNGQNPDYVPRAAEAVWTGPSGFGNVTLHGFVVDADSALLDDTLKRYIDRPSQELGLRVEVDSLFSRVLMLFVESERFQIPMPTPTGRLGSQGAHREKLFAIVMFGARTRPSPGLVAYAPYVYASLPPGWRMEREIFGYPQQLADIVISPEEGDGLLDRLDLKAYAIRRFSPDAISKKDSLILSIEKKQDGQTAVSADQLAQNLVAALIDEPPPSTRQRGRHRFQHRHFLATSSKPKFGVTDADISFLGRCAREPPEREAMESGSGTILSDWRSLGPADDLNTSLLAGAFRMLFLKQFRDIVFADRACYQAIVEAPITASGYKWGIMSGGYRLTLEDLDSAPINRELGVRIGPSEIPLAFRVELDLMEIGDRRTPGTVISNPYWNPATETATPDEHPRLPRYVERGGDAVWRQPSLLHGARIYGFGISVSPEHQRAILNEFVNKIVERCDHTYGDGKFRLVPCTGVGMVMLMFVEYDEVISATDDDSRLGCVSYRECLAMQLALCDDPDFPELDWLIPFIYLDQDSPRLGGREIYGYPKQLGAIPKFKRFNVRGVDIEPAERLELRSTVIRNANEMTARESEPIITIYGERPPATIRQYHQASDMIVDLLAASMPSSLTGPVTGRLFPLEVAGSVATTLSGGVDIVQALLTGAVGHVFLKQFRDCAQPKTACYQAVCKTDTVPGRFRGGARIDPSDYRITIGDLASEQWLTYLDRTAGAGAKELTPDFAYWMDLDIELTTGRVIANAFERAAGDDRTNRRAGAQKTTLQVQRSGGLIL
jgi:Acetoacetate decarboxylase (ADC)